jgi:hypothetical protein
MKPKPHPVRKKKRPQKTAPRAFPHPTFNFCLLTFDFPERQNRPRANPSPRRTHFPLKRTLVRSPRREPRPRTPDSQLTVILDSRVTPRSRFYLCSEINPSTPRFAHTPVIPSASSGREATLTPTCSHERQQASYFKPPRARLKPLAVLRRSWRRLPLLRGRAEASISNTPHI